MKTSIAQFEDSGKAFHKNGSSRRNGGVHEDKVEDLEQRNKKQTTTTTTTHAETIGYHEKAKISNYEHR